MSQLPIEDYGLLGNMRSAAMVSTEGSIDFFCFPNFDSPTIFAALLDQEKGGSFRIDPQIEQPRTKQLYLPGTNILMTRFLSEKGTAELTDFMPVAEIESGDAPAHQLMRVVSVVRGQVSFKVRCAPRFDYARGTHTVSQQGAALCFRREQGDAVTLHASVPLTIQGDDAVAEFTLGRGECAYFAFGAVDPEAGNLREPLCAELIEAKLAETAKFWRNWLKQSRYKGRWREMVERSALVLKLLSSRKHGSLVAAITFGLPEQLGGSRNWDYRYTWLRDTSFSLYAFMRLGFTAEAIQFGEWMRLRFVDSVETRKEVVEAAGPLQLMYRVDGGTDLEEKTLDHLAGYADSRPVRIGNGASSQLQLDIYGELMDAVYLGNKYARAIPDQGWRSLKDLLAWLSKNWEREDEGIWEVRNGRQHFLHSRLMCWVAFDRAIRLAEKRSLTAPLSDWYATRDAIREDIFANFWNEELQSFVQAKGTDVVDAATLLMPLVRFIPPNDPQWVSTMAAIEENLCEDSMVYRYASHSDGLPGDEGAFMACCFWRIECLARQGEVDRARLLFDEMLGYANHLGLYAEELGRGGEQLGNFPQALTHLALISAATYLDRKLSSTGEETWQ